MKTILLHGWLVKVFIVLLWVIAIAMRITMNDDTRENLLFAIIAFSNFLLYLMVAMRLPLLTHSKMAVLLPDFPQKLKQVLLVVFGVSLLPTLLVLPDVVTWLAFISISILSILVFVAMVYQPIYQIFIWLFMLMPLPMTLLDISLNKEKLIATLVWLLPLICWFAYVLLNKLIHYRGNPHHVSKMVALTNVTMGKTLAVQDSIPFADRTKLAQWWANSHFNYYRKMINVATNRSKQISNQKLIEISCQSANSFGANAYILWSVGITLLCVLGLVIDESYHHFFTPMATLIPVMIIGTGSITLFQIIHCKKSYLARLAVLPRFKQHNSFARAFLGYVFFNQAILYCFIAVLLAVTASVFGHINITVYMNSILMLLVYCLVAISIMLFAWRTAQDYANSVVWLMIIGFIGTIIFTTYMTSIDMGLLLFNYLFQTILVCSLLLIAHSSYQYLNYFSKR
jgi:hypothetical protein